MVIVGSMRPEVGYKHKKCSNNNASSNVLFLHRGKEAQETKCLEQCEKIDNCVAMSGIWGVWCMGCKDRLSVPHHNAIGFKKGRTFSLTI